MGGQREQGVVCERKRQSERKSGGGGCWGGIEEGRERRWEEVRKGEGERARERDRAHERERAKGGTGERRGVS